MSQKDIQDYLDNGMYGTPQLKPEEKKKYLGTFRERVIFIATLTDVKKTIYDAFYLKQFNHYPRGTLIIEANCPLPIQNRLMKLAQQTKINFKLIDTDEEHLKSDSIVLVFSIDIPANIEDISVKELSNKGHSSTIEETPKNSKEGNFFSRLFK